MNTTQQGVSGADPREVRTIILDELGKICARYKDAGDQARHTLYFELYQSLEKQVQTASSYLEYLRNELSTVLNNAPGEYTMMIERFIILLKKDLHIM